jgi:hypothetical protein
MHIYNILSHFDRVRVDDVAFLARYPAYTDRSLGLEIFENSGRTVLHCQAGY